LEGKHGKEIYEPHFLKERWGFFIDDKDVHYFILGIYRRFEVVLYIISIKGRAK
jgi:hypothetical protein